MKSNIKKTVLVFAVLAATAALTGCATPYQSEGLTGGYKDRQIDDQTLHVQFWGNGYSTQQAVHKYFLYRCAELTQQHGFKYFMVVPPAMSGALVPTGNLVRSSGFDHSMMQKTAYYVPIIIPSGGGGTNRHEESADIRMFNDDAVLTIKVAGWDAAEVIEQLGPYVSSNGKTPADLPKAWVFEPGHSKVRAEDLLPSAPKKSTVSGT
ncbi:MULTISPECIES: CC0125/CC1285 family lipoprotein [Paraburkholderia]|uniref:Lipoprotein n=3 Tax=Paraburkholderia nemoris TaxID=2793076 RepID=A0ABM8T421_9BURK|nr:MULTISPECIES: hypothetical protein [Paraburkholderia]MBK5153697.1 hypothetical protein [Burkholderia sp. R-69608]MBK5184526.1 hypothetical protein [Burkholderia sp. R-69749]MBK3743441.1 hypothetical protein [Paraburkholderia aspalathi]MBK3816335.1 hypothetical protein [Paraburkholderia aspalathi]CAE6812217.1 hypothetical protein R69619_05718 [Paraburkholderia nemoris]